MLFAQLLCFENDRSFMGGVCTPSALLLFFEEPIRALAHFCEPAANRMPPFIGSSVDIRRENDIPEQGSGRQELDGNE